jgi:DNA-binding transcriptional LysR family regulator
MHGRPPYVDLRHTIEATEGGPVELRQLRYFVTVAQTCHFGQAAEQLHMAQSPLSQAIRQLESHVGATLFNRTTRRVELTPAGDAFLRDAQRILESVDAAQTRVQLIGTGSTGLLRVGSTGLAAYRQLPQLARIAARETPGLVLRFHPDLLTPAQELALEEDRIDLAVLRPPLRRTGLSSRLIARERFVLAVPHSHRLAGDEPVELAELRDEDFVVYSVPDSVVNAAVTHACLAAGFLPRRTHEVAETSIMLTRVAAGLGVALLPESAVALHVDNVRFVPVADDVHIDLALAWRRDDPSPALTRLLEALEANGFITPDADPSQRSAAHIAPLGGTR